MPIKPPSDFTCRKEKGGCGRKVGIIIVPRKFIAMSFYRKTASTRKAVHEDEEVEIPRINIPAQSYCALRLVLEQVCKNKEL